jgi:hypothetical protein
MDMDIENIVSKVADFFGLNKDDIAGKCRLAELAHPRHLAMWLGVACFNIPRNVVAKYFGVHVLSVDYAVGKMDKSKDRGQVKRDIDDLMLYFLEHEDLDAGRTPEFLAEKLRTIAAVNENLRPIERAYLTEAANCIRDAR